MKAPLANLLVALALVGVLGWIDYLTGVEIRAVLFYLFPVGFVAWFNGKASALIIAGASSVAWALAEFNLNTYSSGLPAAWNLLSVTVVFSLLGVTVAHLRLEQSRLVAAHRRTHELLEREERVSRTDVTTGLANAREFLERLESEVARSLRDSKPLCLIYVDLDNFKSINDRYGHLAGDTILREVGTAMRTQLRATDIPARLGGDEFAALLWNTTPDDATSAGERLVEAIVELGREFEGPPLGASIGVVWFDSPPESAASALRAADAAMYQAKGSGKRRAVLVRV